MAIILQFYYYFRLTSSLLCMMAFCFFFHPSFYRSACSSLLFLLLFTWKICMRVVWKSTSNMLYCYFIVTSPFNACSIKPPTTTRTTKKNKKKFREENNDATNHWYSNFLFVSSLWNTWKSLWNEFRWKTVHLSTRQQLLRFFFFFKIKRQKQKWLSGLHFHSLFIHDVRLSCQLYVCAVILVQWSSCHGH